MNRLGAYVAEAFAAIWRNRTRSILTMLGMIIGTSSIIAVLGLSHAASGGIANTIGSLGIAGIFVSPDPNQDQPTRAQIQFRDLSRLRELTAGTIDHITPFLNATYKLHTNGVSYNTTVSSQTDVDTGYLVMREGRRISHDDVVSAAHVAILTRPLAQRFFGDTPAVGRTLRIGGSRFAVIGVYADAQSSLAANLNGSDYADIPFTAFHQIKPGPMDFLLAYPRPDVPFDDARDKLVEALHRINGERTQYVVQDTSAQFAAFNGVLSQVATGLTAIGAVSLLVAGIGIMNIMLVSVAERTREIGLRKSIGASRGDILTQFLFESILLSLFGGGIGSVLGLLTVLAAYGPIASYVGRAPIPYLLILSLAVGFSAFVGCVFGSYPAWRAARLDPVVALRS